MLVYVWNWLLLSACLLCLGGRSPRGIRYSCVCVCVCVLVYMCVCGSFVFLHNCWKVGAENCTAGIMRYSIGSLLIRFRSKSLFSLDTALYAHLDAPLSAIQSTVKSKLSTTYCLSPLIKSSSTRQSLTALGTLLECMQPVAWLYICFLVNCVHVLIVLLSLMCTWPTPAAAWLLLLPCLLACIWVFAVIHVHGNAYSVLQRPMQSAGLAPPRHQHARFTAAGVLKNVCCLLSSFFLQMHACCWL